MFDDKNMDFREVVSEEENKESYDNVVVEEVPDELEPTENKGENENTEDEYEDICYICRRPESSAGKMIRIYGGLTVCNECMQRTLDAMNSGGYGMPSNMNFDFNDLFGMPVNPNQPQNPNQSQDPNKPQNPNKMPHISMINLSDLGMFGGPGGFDGMMGGIPQSQRLKKKKKQEKKVKPVLDIHSIPAPHKILPLNICNTTHIEFIYLYL